jgi:hypothetical protein
MAVVDLPTVVKAGFVPERQIAGATPRRLEQHESPEQTLQRLEHDHHPIPSTRAKIRAGADANAADVVQFFRQRHGPDHLRLALTAA